MLKQTISKIFFGQSREILSFLLAILIVFSVTYSYAQEKKSILLHSARVFDGNDFKEDISILVTNGQIEKIGARQYFEFNHAKVIDLGNATILPGFIELHAHHDFKNIPARTILKHGITTIRDIGGPLRKPSGGKGSLRALTSGPIITAPHGYPIPGLGSKNIAITVSNEDEARKTVRNLIEGGAVVIKIALEPGGETGAPWSNAHNHGHSHQKQKKHASPHDKHKSHKPSHSNRWPLLPENIVKAIVDEAHKNNRKVTAHIGEKEGALIAVNAGVDEWAHVPCDMIPEVLLKKALSQNVKIVGTLDTLSKCSGIAHNAATWSSLGGVLLYGAEIAHPDIPWGIDAHEINYMMQLAKMKLIDVLRSATSKAGQHLNMPLLGSLKNGAPADIIAVKGDIHHNLKALEYPDLVISGGEIVVNNF